MTLISRCTWSAAITLLVVTVSIALSDGRTPVTVMLSAATVITGAAATVVDALRLIAWARGVLR